MDADRRLETVLLGLKDPLSRISLAASRLEALLAPSSLSDAIREAVGELDRGLEDALSSLRPRRAAWDHDVRPGLGQLVGELRPVLGARGIEVTLALPGQPIACDGSLLRRVVCQLLHGVGQWLDERSGVVAIELRAEDGDVRVCVEGRTQAAPAGSGRDLLDSLHGFALAEEVSIESRHAPASGQATLVASLPAAASA